MISNSQFHFDMNFVSFLLALPYVSARNPKLIYYEIKTNIFAQTISDKNNDKRQ